MNFKDEVLYRSGIKTYGNILKESKDDYYECNICGKKFKDKKKYKKHEHRCALKEESDNDENRDEVSKLKDEIKELKAEIKELKGGKKKKKKDDDEGEDYDGDGDNSAVDADDDKMAKLRSMKK